MSTAKPQAKSARYLIIQAIHTHGPLTYDDLTEKIPSLNAAQVKNNVAAAKQPGLVKIGRDDVTGKPLVSLTSSGKDWWKANHRSPEPTVATSSDRNNTPQTSAPEQAASADLSNDSDLQHLAPEDYTLPPADPTLLASANRMLSERLELVASMLHGSGLEDFEQAAADDELPVHVTRLVELFKASRTQVNEYSAAHAISRAFSAAVAQRLNINAEASDEDILRTLDVLTGRITGITHEATPAGYLVAATKRRLTVRREQHAAEKLAARYKRAGAAKAHIFTLYPAGQAVTEVVIKLGEGQ